MKKLKSFRLDEELLLQAESQGLNITKVIESSLAHVLKSRRCPYCGSNLKTKRGESKK